ncbi:hypothetical protein O7632_13280 [Solwaraspora sp. WMMD406]|uniref:hypothetical protein n=1 Tax=Solwaraspora sp. WMMD406 TaxID=3016095 RepID=UPI002416B2A6|nr:hypothetical protein [Solwaraspora sp. WMMD406]MDG4765063.1 hypothetical protein [Solwaraspora sp. WMMD406]
MSQPLEASAEALVRQLEQQQRSIEQSMLSAGRVTATATSPDHSVTVALNHLGHITELTFAGGKYRSMAPGELSRVITDTIARARNDLLDQLSGAYLRDAPASLDVRAVMSGNFDVAKVMRDMVEEGVATHDSTFARFKTMRDGDAGSGDRR